MRNTLFRVCLVSILPTVVMAATINYAGTQTDVGGGLRSTSVTKTRDASVPVDNAYGTDGNEFFAIGFPDPAVPHDPFELFASINLPSYIGDINIAAVPGGGLDLTTSGYDLPMDRPGDPIAAIVADTGNPGAAYKGVTTGTFGMFDIVIGANAPGRFRVGLFVDNMQSFYAGPGVLGLTVPTSFQITQVVGGVAASLTAVTSVEDNVMDGYFFDVSGAATGDTFRVIAGGSGGPNITEMSGITFDSPEPASLALLGLGGLALLRRRPRPGIA